MLIKSFVSNIFIMTDSSYNLSNYIQDKHVWKLCEIGCLHQRTVIALYCLDGNERFLKVFAYPINNSVFDKLKLCL